MNIYLTVCYLVMGGLIVVDNEKLETFIDYFFIIIYGLLAPLVIPITIGSIMATYINEKTKNK